MSRASLPAVASIATLAALPVALLIVDSQWIYSGPYRDHWIYYGYFQNALAYASQFPNLYYSSRLSVNLLGFGFHHLLPPLAANFALHLALYWTAVLGFFGTAAMLFGRRPALLAAICLGAHPWFLLAIGSNYVDGFGLTYFFAALLGTTAAAGGRAPRTALFLAGAAGAAMISANILYVLYLPLLAAAFLFLNRRSAQRPLVPSAGWAAAGGGLTIAALALINRAAGGPLFFLRSSLRFALEVSSGRTPNIWRAQDYTWLQQATWLVFPALATCGALALLLRRRRGRDADPLLLASQLQLLAFAVAVLVLQLAGFSLLQHPYAASLLLPPAFLAFAGQAAVLVEGVPSRAYLGLCALAVSAHLLLWLPGFRRQDLIPWIGSDAPVTAPLLLGLAGVAVLVSGARGAAAAAVLLLAAASSQALIKTRVHQRPEDLARDLFLQMDQAVVAIERSDPTFTTWLWYNYDEENGQVFDAVASAYLFSPCVVNLGFPNLPGPTVCGNASLAPGQRIAVLSDHANAFAEATQALARVGLGAQQLDREEIEGPIAGFAVTFLRIAKGPA